MDLSDFSVLRERCLALVRSELKTHYNGELFDEYVALTAQHRMLLAVPLVADTYRGILGYHLYLQQHGSEPDKSFLLDALHDLTGCLHYQRDDGYSPRTNAYIQYFEQKKLNEKKP